MLQLFFYLFKQIHPSSNTEGMVYDEQIVRVLLEAGRKGLPVRKIARHVFNGCNTLFAPIRFEDVYAYTQAFVRKNSRSSEALLVRGGKRGVYCLNPKSAVTRQLYIKFCVGEDEQEAGKTAPEDRSLSLF